MKLTVYLDMLILINTIINYFLLKAACCIAGTVYSTRRIVLAAFAGALFSMVIFVDLSVYSAFLLKLLAAVICTCISVGFKSIIYFIRNTVCVIAVNMTFTGVLIFLSSENNFVYENNLFYYININPVLLVVCVSGMYRLISMYELFIGNRNKVSLFEFEIYFRQSHMKINAFYDTGFKVKDIISRRAVMLCSFRRVRENLPQDLSEEISDFINGITDRTTNIIPVFYTDISTHGILPALRPDKVIYKNKEIENTLIAFTDAEFEEDIQIIFGKEIFNRTGE